MDCITAGNAMVHLFMQTQPQYRLTNKKLQYLLCIAQMISLSEGRPLFNEKMRNLKNGFMLESVADTFINYKDIQAGAETNKPLRYRQDDFLLPYSQKRLYEIKDAVSDDDKRVLVNTFIVFGGYSEARLNGELNRLTWLRQLPLLSYVGEDDILSFLAAATADPQACAVSVIVDACCAAKVNHERKTMMEQMLRGDGVTENALTTQAEADAVDTATVSAALDELQDAPEQAGPEVVVPVAASVRLLRSHTAHHLVDLVIGKRYAMYMEVAGKNLVPRVSAVAVPDNSSVQGNLQRLTDTVYCYSFAGVASDVKISVDV